ncbi:MAG: AAA family ATPase [Candidatus Ozemobacteraceae bacterium]
MKILNVRFANINSLKGDFEIDFTNAELAGHGIFAIVGQTGSGKTTILDAITLALFGQTSRLQKLSGGENELMTRGAGFCHAEVTFEATVEKRSLVLRSIWEQRRARNLPAGNLQPPQMHLVQVEDKRPTDTYEAAGLTNVPRKVEEVTGLDFNRFTRTCLLAQGQFAAFLDAKSGDRALILEQITGTGIYFLLSKEAFERDKEVVLKVAALQNELQGMSIMSDEEFSVLQEKVESLDLERKACDAQKQTIQQHIGWVKNLNTLLENRENLLVQQQTLNTERESHAAGFVALAQGRKAEPARVLLAQRDGFVEKRLKHENEWNETKNRLPIFRQTFVDSQAQLELTKKNRIDFQKVMEVEQKLITEARAFDQQVRNGMENHAGISRQHEATAKQLSAAEADVQKLGETIVDLHRLQEGLNVALEETVADKALGSDLKALEALSVQRQEVAKQLTAANTEREKAKSRIAQAQDDLRVIDESVKKAAEKVRGETTAALNAEKAVTEGFPGITLKALQEKIKQSQKQQTDATTLQILGAELRGQAEDEKKVGKAVRERAGEIQTAVAGLSLLEKDREKIDAGIEELNEQKTRIQTMASLEEHRQLLEDGKPCPLCGALKHPFVDQKPDSTGLKEIDSRLKKEKGSLKKVAEQIKKNQEKLTKLTSDQAVDEHAIKNHEKTATDLRKKWEQPARELGIDSSPDAVREEQLEALVTTADGAFKNAETAFENFQKAVEARDKAEKALSKAKEKFQDLEKEQTSAQGTLNQATALEQSSGRRCAELVQQTEAIEGNLRGEVIVYGFSDFDEEVLPKLKTRWEAYQKCEKKRDQAIQDEQQARQKLVAASTQKEGFTLHLIEYRDALTKAKDALTAIRTARSDMYGDKDPDFEEKKLRITLADHQTREEAAGEHVQTCRLTLEGLNAKEKSLAADLERLSGEIAESSKALEAIRQSGGFADEPSLRAALLPPEELKRLSDLERHFETKTAQLQGQLEGLKKQIADHEAQRPTFQTLEDLTQAEALQTEKASQALAAWQEQWKTLTTHQENRQKHQNLMERIKTTRKDGERWTKLNVLIGSANGKKFQEFAQGLTFSNLVVQANRQLDKLTDRYHLANDGLELQVIDRYIANARASAKNLSGGEKFLASLSLALGLAHMVGRKYRMDTLFIDEGFGALDPQTLETAIAVLCGLQQQGKLIGVISHVEALKERLPVRLEVQRLGGGLSTISGAGCTRHS